MQQEVESTKFVLISTLPLKTSLFWFWLLTQVENCLIVDCFEERRLTLGGDLKPLSIKPVWLVHWSHWSWKRCQLWYQFESSWLLELNLNNLNKGSIVYLLMESVNLNKSVWFVPCPNNWSWRVTSGLVENSQNDDNKSCESPLSKS
jgi:hypothetical protein